tara:strand:+ start:257 stop:1393 length:1137 start_codon:yes stop_codon:yes gene_type:complete
MDTIDKVLLEWSLKTDKGYPDINSKEDMDLFESMFGFNFLSENAFERKVRQRIIDVAPNDLETRSDDYRVGNKNKIDAPTFINYIKTAYPEAEVEIIPPRQGKNRSRTFNAFSFQVDGKEINLNLAGGGKEQQTRQESSLINTINEFEPKPFTLVSSNKEKIKNVTGARKVSDTREGEAYADIVIETTEREYKISAKDSEGSPSIAGGGLKMASNLGPEVEKFIKDFYEDAYKYYEKIFKANPELTDDTNLYDHRELFKDVSREVPRDILKTLLVGNERFGGPVDMYYIGPMTVESVGKGNELHIDGEITTVDQLIKNHPTVYAFIRKREGSFYFTSREESIPANKDLKVRMIFSKTPTGLGFQSRFGMNFEKRGSLI